MEKYTENNDIYEYFTITLYNLLAKEPDILNGVDFGFTEYEPEFKTMFLNVFKNYYWYNEIAFTTPELFKIAFENRFNVYKNYYRDKLNIYYRDGTIFSRNKDIWNERKRKEIYNKNNEFNDEIKYYDLPNKNDIASQRQQSNDNATNKEDFTRNIEDNEPYVKHLDEILNSVQDIILDFVKKFKDLFLSVYRIL